jgi:hypothetical protein
VDALGGLQESSGLADFTAFIGSSPQGASTGIYWAGANPTARDNANPYYSADFPGGQKPPLLQQATYPQQNGALSPGTVGFVWCDVIISKQGNTVEWSLNGLKIATITNAPLNSSNVFAGYWAPFLTISDNPSLSFGLVDNLRVEQPLIAPVIILQPQNIAINQGGSVTFSVQATGVPGPAYQWRFNGTNIIGATNNSYTITNAQAINVGSYSVLVSNIQGSIASRPALLSLNSSPSIFLQPRSQYLNEGDNVTFIVGASGTAPLNYQWRFVPAASGTTLQTFPWSSNDSLTITNIQLSDAGAYSVVVSNVAGIAISSNAILRVNLRPVANASATQPLMISSNGTNATVVLDGSRSYDLDGDALQYLWLRAGAAVPLATGVVAVVTLPIGTNNLQLVVSDLLASSTNSFTVAILTPAEAVQRLISITSHSGLPHAQSLIATLFSAIDSIHRGDVKSAINQLEAFQNKVRAQVSSIDPALADQFIEEAARAIDALSASETGPRTILLAQTPHLDSHGKLSFKGGLRRIYLIEASTNLTDWEIIGTAADHGDGTFEFYDQDVSKHSSRFYRIIGRGPG